MEPAEIVKLPLKLHFDLPVCSIYSRAYSMAQGMAHGVAYSMAYSMTKYTIYSMAYGKAVIQVVLKTFTKMLPSCWLASPALPLSLPLPLPGSKPHTPSTSSAVLPCHAPQAGRQCCCFSLIFFVNSPFLLLVFLCRCNKTMATKNAKIQQKKKNCKQEAIQQQQQQQLGEQQLQQQQ